MRRTALGVVAALVAVLLHSSPAAGSVTGSAIASGCAGHVPAGWCGAVSQPARDSVYPKHSMPGVDALHYRLALRWAPTRLRLLGHETLVFRAARSTPSVRLALGGRMHVLGATLDGRRVRASHPGAVLVLHRAVARGTVHTVRLEYAGRPAKALPLKDQRNAVGMFHTPGHDIFTNDEPVGAFTWYAVGDQPADKALYDFELSVPAPRVGVANGRMVSRHRVGDQVVTRFHLDKPAASYLVTVEFGRYRMTRAGSVHGTPVTLWTPPGDSRALATARFFPKALRWVEGRLGRYPFDTLSLIVVKGYNSGMENQTLVTVGDTEYDTAKYTLVHEVVHQWYGDDVTPRDWRDVWMNEGMAMYLQDVWTAKDFGISLADYMTWTEPSEAKARKRYGPPGAYDPKVFAATNVYYSPALMWDQLRKRVGGKAFWSMVRAWPRVHHAHNASRAQYLDWVQHRLHRDLGHFFHAWLMGRTTPPIH